jgi:hypothetical protein
MWPKYEQIKISQGSNVATYWKFSYKKIPQDLLGYKEPHNQSYYKFSDFEPTSTIVKNSKDTQNQDSAKYSDSESVNMNQNKIPGIRRSDIQGSNQGKNTHSETFVDIGKNKVQPSDMFIERYGKKPNDDESMSIFNMANKGGYLSRQRPEWKRSNFGKNEIKGDSSSSFGMTYKMETEGQ